MQHVLLNQTISYNCLDCLQDKALDTQMTVLTDRSQGGGSPIHGSIELMVSLERNNNPHFNTGHNILIIFVWLLNMQSFLISIYSKLCHFQNIGDFTDLGTIICLQHWMEDIYETILNIKYPCSERETSKFHLTKHCRD